jgi:hypothetical protein
MAAGPWRTRDTDAGMKRIGLLCLAAACGSSSAKQPDAAIHVDGPADAARDAPVDVAVDAPADATSATGNHFHYVINSIHLPNTTTAARDEGFDLNGDGTVDNQLGMVTSAMSGQGFDITTPTDQAIARGDSITLADLQTTSFTNATGAGFTLYAGTNPNPMPCTGSGDTVCGHHLTGTGSFDVAAMPRDTPIVGPVAVGTLTASGGHLTVPLYVLSPMPASVTLLAAHVKVGAGATGMFGNIGGAVSMTDIQTKVYPAMRQGFTAIVARDCTMLANPPACGCAQSSTGATLIGLFDADQDCAISLTEIQNNQLIQSLFMPDVTVEGQQALSIGFQFEAVGAMFTP